MKVDQSEKRKNEKGAAMVMVLLISLLLLTASAGLLMESSMNTQNVSDATAEQQAYNAAESGLQSTINVLRGYSAYQKNGTDTINFRKAVSLSTSNASGDPSTTARLSRWITYNYSSNGSFNDRVKLGSGNDYSFSVTVTDPNDTGQIIGFETRGEIWDPTADGGKGAFKTLDDGSNTFTIGNSPGAVLSYKSHKTNPDLDVKTGSANTKFGTFKLSSAASITVPSDIRFRIIVTMTAPYSKISILRGSIKANTTASSQVKFDFDSTDFDVRGSIFSLTGNAGGTDLSIFNVSLGSQADVLGKVGQAEPYRVVVRSVGYGPRGAKKVLEATVQKNFFNGLSAPAALTLIGAKTAANGNFTFKPGTSNVVEYSGDDISSSLNIPSLGTTNNDNLRQIYTELAAQAVKTNPDPPAENVSTEVPFWLESTKNLNDTINDLRNVAKASGKYYTSGQAPNNFGNVSTSNGITFIDGDVEFSGNGGGILVCTGKLTLKGTFTFNGLIIVTGNGGIERSGGGTGILRGNTVVAPYNPADLNAGFLAPKYDISGGGNSTIRYDSNSVANGMTAVSNFVLGVAEK